MKKLIIAGLCVAASMQGFAQTGKVMTAFNLYTDYQQSGNKDAKSLEEAYSAINEATKNENTKDENKTWYYKGFICQLIFQDSTLQPKYPNILQEASEAYQKVITLSEGPDGKKKNVEDATNNLAIVCGQLHNYGIVLFDKGKDDAGAYAAFNEAIAINNFMAKRNLQSKIKVKIDNTKFLAAVTADKLKKTEEAKTLYRQLIDSKYDNIYIYKALASIYGDEKDSQKALEVLNEGVKAYPDSSTLTIDVLNVYLTTGRQTEALDIMNKAIAQDPKNAQLYFVLANTYGRLKDEEKTIANYQKAIDLDPKYADAYNNLGAVYLDKANALVDKMADPKIKDAEYQQLDKQRSDYLKQALPYLEKASDLKPESIEILDVLKTIYAKMGDYDKVKATKEKMDKLRQQKGK